jgi:hypothetical protein
VLQFVTLIDIVLGQKGTVNPSAMLASLLSRRAKLHEELRSIEKQVTFSIIASQFFFLGIYNIDFFLF